MGLSTRVSYLAATLLWLVNISNEVLNDTRAKHLFKAAAPGGPFPQIDASEFTYQIVLFENHGRFVSTYR